MTGLALKWYNLFKKNFESIKLFKIFSTLFLISLFIKFVDLVKGLIIASFLGVSHNADIYMALISIPESLVVLVGLDSIRGIINSEFSALYSTNNLPLIRSSFVNLFKLVFLISLVFVLLIILLRGQIIDLLLPGFDSDKKNLSIALSLFIFPIFFFKALIGLFQSVFNAMKKYYLPVILPVIVSLTMIGSVFMPLYNNELIFNLSIGCLIGNFLLCIVLGSRLLDIKGFSGFKLEFDDETKKIIKGSASIIVLVFVNQLYLFSKNYFASFFGDGSLSALSYASSISSVISGLIFFSVFNALISELSSGFAKDIRLKIKKIFTNTFLNLIFLIVPIIVVLVVFRTEILSLVYLRGNFDIEGIRKTETPFVWETLSMFTHILFTIPAALYLAKKKYLLLTKIGVFVYIFGILSNYIFSLLVGYWGISASNFVVTGLHGVLLIVYSRKFIGKCGEYGYRIFLLIISGFISYVLLFFWRMFMKQLFAIDSTVENVILVLASAIVLLLSYFAVTSLFKINYASKIMSAFLR